MTTARRHDRLSFRLVAAGALILLAFLPFAWSSNKHTHPVVGYKKMAIPVHVTPAATER